MDEINKLKEENQYAKAHVNADIVFKHDKHHPALKHHLGQLHLNHEHEPQVHPVNHAAPKSGILPLHEPENL
jgi:hypothetical protein